MIIYYTCAQVSPTGKLILSPAFQRDKMVTGKFIERATVRHPRDPLPQLPDDGNVNGAAMKPAKRNPTDKLPSPPVPAGKIDKLSSPQNY